MKKLFRIFFAIAVLNFVFLSSCKESTENPAPADKFATLTQYMASNGLDLPDVLDGWIVAPPASVDEAQAFIDSYFIIDIRSSGDYNAGHIPTAVNSTLAGILDAAKNATKPILVVCYTGQTAAHGVVALRLSGHKDAKVLKWGMSGWNSNFSGPWTGNTGDVAVGHTNWSTTNTIKPNETFETPNFSTTADDGAGILAERVKYMLTEGFKGIANTVVLDDPAQYHINNYWAKADVDKYGHIKSAYRVSPLTLSNITTMNPAKPVVTYCWTGQTSSMITAYLTVLGYNAKSLKFGTNGMIYSELESHKFTVPSVDLPVEEP